MTRSFRFSIVRAVLVVPVLLTLHIPARAQGGCVTGGSGGCTSSAPEMDPGMVSGGLALLGGVMLVVRGRRRNGSS
jgi:MYXO-CTERM domain-containing protein